MSVVLPNLAGLLARTNEGTEVLTAARAGREPVARADLSDFAPVLAQALIDAAEALRETLRYLDESVDTTGCTMDELLATTPGNEYTYLASAMFTARAVLVRLADIDKDIAG